MSLISSFAFDIILFIVALDHLTGADYRSRDLQPSDVPVFRLATTPIAGPGAISTVMIISSPPYSPFLALVAIACNAVVSFFVLSSSDWVRKVLGANGTVALSRITALQIAAVAVSFVVLGLGTLFSGLR